MELKDVLEHAALGYFWQGQAFAERGAVHDMQLSMERERILRVHLAELEKPIDHLAEAKRLVSHSARGASAHALISIADSLSKMVATYPNGETYVNVRVQGSVER